MTMKVFVRAAIACLGCAGALAQAPAIVKSGLIYENAPFPSCHASTIVETRDGMVAAWFGGTDEGELDVGIWLSRDEGKGWSAPVEVATGYEAEKRRRYPCWNPVLFQPSSGPLLLFYKVGPSPSKWWGLIKTSQDGGKTWSSAKYLPEDIYGPIRSKPVELPDGTLLCGSSTEHAGWRVHMERTKDPLGQWTRTQALNSAMEYGAIQPTLLVHSPERIQILCRTKQRKITESWSYDRGLTWTRMMPVPLPNPNAGFDAVVLKDGRSLLVYNHLTRGRGLLNVAISEANQNVSSNANPWNAALVLENEPKSEFSYPAAIQDSRGLVHVTYTWKRQRIKHVVIDPAKLSVVPILNGEWPQNLD